MQCHCAVITEAAGALQYASSGAVPATVAAPCCKLRGTYHRHGTWRYTTPRLREYICVGPPQQNQYFPSSFNSELLKVNGLLGQKLSNQVLVSSHRGQNQKLSGLGKIRKGISASILRKNVANSGF